MREPGDDDDLVPIGRVLAGWRLGVTSPPPMPWRVDEDEEFDQELEGIEVFLLRILHEARSEYRALVRAGLATDDDKQDGLQIKSNLDGVRALRASIESRRKRTT